MAEEWRVIGDARVLTLVAVAAVCVIAAWFPWAASHPALGLGLVDTGVVLCVGAGTARPPREPGPFRCPNTALIHVVPCCRHCTHDPECPYDGRCLLDAHPKACSTCAVEAGFSDLAAWLGIPEPEFRELMEPPPAGEPS